jgi:surface polysaccharide O-acyltransferase-like enzyme
MSRLSGDFLRLLAIVAVLIAHATSACEWRFCSDHQFVSESFVGAFLNQLARFCVPIFVILSGYGLTLKYNRLFEKGTVKFGFPFVWQFFKDRAARIGLPFLVWTLVFLFLANKFISFNTDWLTFISHNLQVLGRYLCLEGADYHFYFFLIIIECYLVFPLLVKIKSYSLWIFLLLMQIFFTSPSHILLNSLGIHRPDFPSSFIIYWVFYFYTGVLFAHHLAAIKNFVMARSPLWFILAIAASFGLVLFEYIYWSYHQNDPGNYNHFHRQSIILYTFATLFFFVRFDGAIEKILGTPEARGKAITLGAELSFAVYIFHTTILRLLNKTFLSHELFMLMASLLVISFGLIYLVNRVVLKPAVLRKILGLP